MYKKDLLMLIKDNLHCDHSTVIRFLTVVVCFLFFSCFCCILYLLFEQIIISALVLVQRFNAVLLHDSSPTVDYTD